MQKRIVNLVDTKLGDKIKLFEGYGTATIYRINPDNSRQVWRPYITVSENEYSGQTVIPYIGIEDFAVYGSPVELID